jgi:DNA segregation ATPase FtsK/SpoIIIE, S-DNA-T family
VSHAQRHREFFEESLMKRALEQMFQKQAGEQQDASASVDRVVREIRGSIFALVSLFLLVALTSYIQLDSINILQGRIDQINNFAGIVGALVAEGILGSVGAPGYSIILLTATISLLVFVENPVHQHLFKFIGVLLGTLLTAVTINLIFVDSFPEVSLWQGGLVGRHVGAFLRQYFNTGGAILMVAGGYLLTFILTTGLSLGGMARLVFDSQEESEDKEEQPFEAPSEDEDEAGEIAAATATVVPQLSVVSASKPKRKKKTIAATTEQAATEEDAEEQTQTQIAAAVPTNYEYREMIPYTGAYQTPSLRLLKTAENKVKRMSKADLKEKGEMIVSHLQSFQINGVITAITEGPVLTTYEFKPAAGVKLSKIAALQDDLGVVLGTNQLRVIAPIPGKTVVGIEVPRPQSEVISLKEVLSQDGFMDKKLALPVALGKSTDGRPLFGDLAAMPHLLVAGATGSGKSVFMNSLIMSFLFRLSPQQLRMILIDPKMLEFAAFAGLPHLVADVITDNKVAINAMNWAVTEMDRRYALMAKTGSKNIESYNSKQRKAEDKIPLLVVVVDELADLMMSGGEMVEVAITRLAQKARASGIHLVIATQRPSAEVITGLIKANIPSRISFKVPSGIDSRTILDTSGAEGLMGRGDSLMITPGIPLRRIHGTFVTEEELERTVNFAKGGKKHTKHYISFAGNPQED